MGPIGINSENEVRKESAHGPVERPDQRGRAGRNRTLSLTPEDRALYAPRLLSLSAPAAPEEIADRILHQDLEGALEFLPDGCVDLMILDPPYNLTKSFNGQIFKKRSEQEYGAWFESFFIRLLPLLKPEASLYVCSDWRSAGTLQTILERHSILRNRITWEREKGRGAQNNWKNCSEDIWFCTAGKRYTFHPERVKLKRRVIAPYRDGSGEPKDWMEDREGRFRLTHASNLWTDITVPFWSMPENTNHPTQKPEKLIAKLILASSNEGELVFDPFAGSGTTAVIAKKLKRRYLGVEINQDYCLLAEKRLALCEGDTRIQGYEGGIFHERNAKL